MKLIKWLSILLSVSLGANFFFIYTWYNISQTNNTPSSSAQKTVKVPGSHEWNKQGQGPKTDKDETNARPSESPVFTNIDDPALSQQQYYEWLENLAKAKEFEKLEFELREYLRRYPQDTNAIILEAKAYYHNKPLNTALVHYHGLLSKPLSEEQLHDIEKLIAVNTTRIIQQFSADGAWDMLAAFLEPLVQVAPTNRQYLMALARAYGMQTQFSLMEDILATFPSDDIRSMRLRDNVTARINNTVVDEPLVSLADQNKDVDESLQRRPDVLIRQQRGQFISRVRILNTSVRLLVDTGASTTALSDVKFSDIDPDDVEFLGLFKVNTAGGSIEAPIYKVKSMDLGQQTLLNTSVLVLPSENLGQYDGLLGMNVLSQFDLRYDATSETMRMYKKRG